MPTVKLNKTVFEQLVGKKLPLEKLKDRISMLGTDLEGIQGDEIEVEIFPNRPDMLSEQGFARAFSSFIGKKTGLRKYNVKKSGKKVIVDKNVTMRPFTVCAIVKNLKFDDEKIREVMQMQEKLATTHGRNRKKSAYGIYPLNPIEFPVQYIAKDPSKIKFKPLGFNKEVIASEVIETHPKGKAYNSLTQGWKKYPFFIDNKENVMCMLPFTNSDELGKIDTSTKDVFIECSGVDLGNVQIALNILTTALADMGGEIYSLDIEYHNKTITTPNFEPSPMKFDLEYVNKRLGLDLSQKEAVILLEKMGFGFEKGNVLIPAYRGDIIHQADLAEDIAIAYGYENFEEIIPNVATIGQEAPFEIFCNKLREIAIGNQLIEIKNYHLITKEDCNEKMLLESEVIGLLNSLGEHNHLRNSLLPSVLKTFTGNQHHEYPQNIFEIGRTFVPNAKAETKVQESEKFAIGLASEETDYTQIRQVIDTLFTQLGIEYSVKETEHASFIPGRVANVLIGKKSVATFGEIHPQVLENWQLTVPITLAEINIEDVFEIIKK